MEILLVIDMQQKYMNSYELDLMTRVNTRIKEAVESDVPVVYIRNVGKIENIENYNHADELKIVSECSFTKRWPSAFSSDDFVQFIQNLKVDTINMVGVDGRCCVARTALEAVKRGYKVRIYLDSVAARNDNFYLKELPEMRDAGVEIIAD